jgi:hypothetical protein
MIELATTLTASKPMSKADKIRKYIAENPKATPPEVAKAVGTGLQYVYSIVWKMKQKSGMQKKKDMTNKAKLAKALKTQKQVLQGAVEVWRTISTTSSDKQIEMFEPKPDPVNHPAHYKVGGIETIDFIEAKKLGYNLGNVVKYLTRADHKGNRLQDLRKAQWYLEREIWNVENNKKTA